MNAAVLARCRAARVRPRSEQGFQDGRIGDFTTYKPTQRLLVVAVLEFPTFSRWTCTSGLPRCRTESFSAPTIAIESICRRLADLAESPRVVCLRICDDSDQGVLRTSSVARELDFLQSHTIHHYAIIAMLCRLQNVVVEQGFGVAPSTLRYQLTSKMQCATND